MRLTATKFTLPAVMAAFGVCLGVAPAVSAQDTGQGWNEGPVQFSATGDDQCQVHFTIVNETNAYYVVDYTVDGEDPTSLVGVPGAWSQTGVSVRARFTLDTVPYDITRTVGRFGVQNSAPATPVFASGTAPYENNRTPITTTRTVDLLAQPRLPNRNSDTHTVSYQVVLGPQSPDKGFDTDTGEFALLETEVSGCQTETTSTLAAPPEATAGTPVDLTVQVEPDAVAGTVQFFSDEEPIGAPVEVSDGVATLPYAFTEVGDRVITATFTPTPVADDSVDTPHAPSTAGPVTVSVVGEEPSTGSLGAGSLLQLGLTSVAGS